MVKIVGSPFYSHAFQATMQFSFGRVRLSIAFFDEWVYVVVPDDRELRLKIAKEQTELMEFLVRIRPETTKMLFIPTYGDQGAGTDGQEIKKVEQDKAGPATQSPSPYQLPFGSR